MSKDKIYKKPNKHILLLSGGLLQTLKKAHIYEWSVCSLNYAHIHIKPVRVQTKESVP